MRSSSSFVSLALAALASVAGATCTDTLFLQSITVYKQSLKNAKTLGATWDSVVVNPWDSVAVLASGPVGFVRASAGPDTAIHYTRFQYDCGVDSVSSVQGLRVIDTIKRQGEDYVHRITTEKFVTESKVTMNDGGGDGITYLINGKEVTFARVWSSDLFDVGRLTSQSPREAFQMQYRSYVYRTQGGYATWSSSTKTRSIFPSRDALTSSMQSFITGNLNPYIDSIGTSVDSVRENFTLYRYVYDTKMPAIVGVRARSISNSRFIAQEGSNGWTIRLPYSAQVQILSIDGRVARQIPAGRDLQWDGRDATGQRVRPGVWMIRAEGIGATPILVH